MKIPLLHIHGQGAWHDDCWLVGNKQGLRELRNAIDKALKEGKSSTAEYAADKEGYTVFVIMDDSGLEENGWQSAMRPYSEEMAQDNRDNCLEPWKRLTRDEYQRLFNATWEEEEKKEPADEPLAK